MNTTGREVIGECSSDLLLANANFPVNVVHVTVKTGQNLDRGSILATDADNKCVILGTEGATAAYILAEGVDASKADAVAEAYVSGQFIKNALLVLDGYTLTADDEKNLRNGGIYLENAMAE